MWISNMVENEWKSLELWRSVIAECLATFFYVFMTCTVTLNWAPNVYRVVMTPGDLLRVAMAAGLALCTLIQCFGHISGSHINPAISIATLVTCKVTPLRGLLYIMAQCGGGIAGAALLYGIVPDDTRGLLGSTILHPSLTPSQGFGVEFLMTFILTFTFFATMDPKRRNQGNDAIALGMTMTLLHIVGYRLSGSSCNPARSLGPAFVRNTWQNHWVYWAGPIAGSVVAGLLYQFVFAHTRGYKHRACNFSGIQQLNKSDQSELSFVIYGNNKNRKKLLTPPVLPPTSAATCAASLTTNCASVVTSSAMPDFGNDLTTGFFRAETSRKYLVQHHQPVAPPGSLETDLDIVVPHSSQVASDDVSSPRQMSLYNTSSDYEVHQLDNVVNTLKNVV